LHAFTVNACPVPCVSYSVCLLLLSQAGPSLLKVVPVEINACLVPCVSFPAYLLLPSQAVPSMLEVVPVNINKWTAMSQLLLHLELPRTALMAGETILSPYLPAPQKDNELSTSSGGPSASHQAHVLFLFYMPSHGPNLICFTLLHWVVAGLSAILPR
jgi:hypothetical protein